MNCLAVLLAMVALALSNVHSHDLYVLNTPESVKINQSIPIRSTDLADIVSTMFGFTVSREANTWNNLLVADPFSLPEAVVVLEIPGLKNPGFDLNKIDHHNLVLDESLDNVYAIVERRMKERLGNKKYSLLHGSLTDEEFLKNQVFHSNFKLNPIIPVNIDSNEDNNYKLFLKELEQLNQLSQGVKESMLKNNVADFHWFKLQGVKAMAVNLEQNSIDMNENKAQLNQAISSLVDTYNEIYNNQVFFIAITNDGKQSHRSKREAENLKSKYNVRGPANDDYPVVFNILLWFTVVFIFSLLAISLSIGQMDPGRDSIIYRMTSNRMKKEN